MTVTKPTNRSIDRSVTTASLPGFDVLKEQEKLLLIERKMQPQHCKFLTHEEIVTVLLNML